MNPGLLSIVAANAASKALLGSNPLRFYPYGEADEKTAKPYAVWQTAYGSPFNFLAGTPTDDSWGVQIDVYGADSVQATKTAEAVRAALEPHGYLVSYNGEGREAQTRLYRYSFTMEFMTTR